MKKNQPLLAEQFYALHHTGNLLILPNIWDALGASLLETLGYPAVATASAATAFSNGFDDGENLPFEELLILLEKIVDQVAIPVTADIETAYARDEYQLKDNIGRLIDTGIVGINFEDTNRQTNELVPINEQCGKIQLIANIARGKGTRLFINARTDVLLRGGNFPNFESKINEILKRGQAYKEAGADCFYPIALWDEDYIAKVVGELKMPINIGTLPGVSSLEMLQKIGVARVSLGPAFLKFAIKHMRELALKLKNFEGLSDIAENEISTQFLKDLVNKPIGE